MFFLGLRLSFQLTFFPSPLNFHWDVQGTELGRELEEGHHPSLAGGQVAGPSGRSASSSGMSKKVFLCWRINRWLSLRRGKSMENGKVDDPSHKPPYLWSDHCHVWLPEGDGDLRSSHPGVRCLISSMFDSILSWNDGCWQVLASNLYLQNWLCPKMARKLDDPHICVHTYVYIYNTFPIKMAYIGHILGVNSAVFIGPRLLQVKPLGIIESLRRGHRKKRPKVARKETLSNWSHRSWKSSETPKRSVKKIKTGHNMTGTWTSRTYFDYTLWGFWLTLYYCVRITKSFTFFSGQVVSKNWICPTTLTRKKHGFSAFAS